jgi:hypothetical protein
MRVYLSGKMTGLPDFNYPAFNEAAAKLRALGLEVCNPAENPAPPCGTWTGYMRMALRQLVDCDCIVLLPGWSDSKGALIERRLAQALGMAVSHFFDVDGVPVVPLLTAFESDGQVGAEPVPAFFWGQL